MFYCVFLYLGSEVDVKCDAGYRGSGYTKCTVCTVKNTFNESSNQGYVRNKPSTNEWFFEFQDGKYGQTKKTFTTHQIHAHSLQLANCCDQVYSTGFKITLDAFTVAIGKKYKTGSGSDTGWFFYEMIVIQTGASVWVNGGICGANNATIHLHGEATAIRLNGRYGIIAGGSSNFVIHLPSHHNTIYNNGRQDRHTSTGGTITNVED